MPFYCITENGRFRDLSEIDADNLLRYMNNGERTVRTEPSSVSEYEAFFAAQLTGAENVIHITMSSSISGNGHENVLKAADSFANVHIFDGRSISSGIGMVAIHAAELAKKGAGVEAILKSCGDYVPRVTSNFLVPHPETTGRNELSGVMVKFITKALNYEPVFTVKKGVIRLNSFRMGYVYDTVEEFVKRALKGAKDADTSRLFVNYCGCTATERENVLNYVRRYAQFDEVIVQKTSATLSCNCGMHSVGLTYAKKEKR